MSMGQRFAVFALLAAGVAGCSSAPSQRQLAQDAVAAMGGADKLAQIQTLVMKGEGTRTKVGQVRKAGEPDAVGKLTNVIEIVDLANDRAAFDYDLQIDDFTQHRREVISKAAGAGKPIGIESVGGVMFATAVPGLFSWGTQNSPDFLIRRNPIGVAIAATDSASASLIAQDKEFDGKTYKHATGTSKTGEDLDLYFDPQTKLLAGFEVLETETMLGDVTSQYILGDYKAVDGIMLPHHVKIRKGGQDYSEIQFSSITLNDPAAEDMLKVPEQLAADAEQAAEAADSFPMKLVKAGNGVFQAQGFRHHSMVVEFPTFIAVVEAPYLEIQTKALVRQVQAQFPDKPIRYAAVTHPHFDHTGGVRAIAAAGATVLVEKSHEAALKELLDTPHTHPADDLDRKRRAAPPQATGSMEMYESKKVITEGAQTLELYAVAGSPHVDPIILAYVPSSRVLFQSDLFFPGLGAGGGPAVTHLLDSIRKLNLRVDTMVGGHGLIGPFSELVKAAASGD